MIAVLWVARAMSVNVISRHIFKHLPNRGGQKGLPATIKLSNGLGFIGAGFIGGFNWENFSFNFEYFGDAKLRFKKIIYRTLTLLLLLDVIAYVIVLGL
jgi:hypothetical protein